ncbi:TRADD-N-associated membrane domain-containing protein [Microcoleus sp. D2_18a_B4]|uniref:TRADD-N-associated membrane domain-containing protein n=1 Tax=Microcoleus sp. D2_18a_B4 TaxID=3055329 RepID=UPI002FD2F6F0
MKSNLSSKSHPDQDYSDIAEEILEEWLRQARQSYNVALTVIGTSAILAFVGVGLVYVNQVREGAITTAAGGVTTVAATRFANQKKKELQEMMELVEKRRAKEELRKKIPRPQAPPPVKPR